MVFYLQIREGIFTVANTSTEKSAFPGSPIHNTCAYRAYNEVK